MGAPDTIVVQYCSYVQQRKRNQFTIAFIWNLYLGIKKSCTTKQIVLQDSITRQLVSFKWPQGRIIYFNQSKVRIILYRTITDRASLQLLLSEWLHFQISSTCTNSKVRTLSHRIINNTKKENKSRRQL